MPARIAFLGPRGTYSHEAAILASNLIYSGSKCEFVPAQSLADVVKTVAFGKSDIAALPVENSTNGAVSGAWDALLKESSLKIIGQVKVPVRHQLFSNCKDISDIKTVYSHPQVWGQTQQWRAKNLPNIQCIDASSTAEAAHLAINSSDRGAAAISGPGMAKELGLRPLVEDVADLSSNTTRFLVLAGPDHPSNASIHIHTTTSLTQLANLLSDSDAYFVTSRPRSEPWEFTYIVEKTLIKGRL